MKVIPKVLLIGAGKFGVNHIRILKKLEDEKKIKFVGVVIRNKENREKILKEYKVNVYLELNTALLKSVDAVDIVTPPETHFDIVKKCLLHCDVFVEKPVTVKVFEAEKLGEIAKKYKRILIVGHIFRYHEISKKLRSILQNKEMPRKISGSFINPILSDQGREPTVELLHLFDVVDFIWQKRPQNISSRSEKRLSIVDIRYAFSNDARFVLGWDGDEKIRQISFKYKNKIIEADFIKNIIEIKNNNRLIVKRYYFKNIKEPLYLELFDFIKNISRNKSNIKMATRVLSIAVKSIPKNIRVPKVAIIGGGIFGISVAHELGTFCDVTLLEKNGELMQEGTMINQFRHHYGYHYPRSDETVIDVQRSRVDFEEIFKDALYVDSPTYYALAKHNSKVNVSDFIKFCDKHKLPYYEEYPHDDFLLRDEVDLCIRVPEPSYHHKILKKIAESKINSSHNIKLYTNTVVDNCTLEEDNTKNISYIKNGKLKKEKFDFIVNATYANINRFVNWLSFEQCPIRVDLAEVLIVKLSTEPVSITVIDGPFATLMPTGNKNEFTLYHVKESIIDRYVPTDGLVKKVKKYKTNRDAIMRESLKFFPILKDAIFIESRIVHRGVQAYHEHDDARVADLIDHGFGCWSILSGKILSSVTTAKKLASAIRNSISS